MYIIYVTSEEYKTIYRNLLYNTIKSEHSLSSMYINYKRIFFKKNADQMLIYNKQNHEINLEEDKFRFNLLYNLSVSKLQMLCKYINKNLIKNFIRFLSLSADVSILFIKKIDNTLQLYINY